MSGNAARARLAALLASLVVLSVLVVPDTAGAGDPPTTGTIYGELRGGKPRTRVTAYGWSPGSTPEKAAMTAVNGRYRITGLAPGVYGLRFQPVESSGMQSEWYANTNAWWAVDPIAVYPGDERRIDAGLAELNVVVGRLRDPDGNPVPNVRALLVEPERGFVKSAVSDATGDFRIERVPRGEWVLLYEPLDQGPDAVAYQFSPGSPLLSGAPRIHLLWGVTLRVPTEVLPWAGSVSGQATGPTSTVVGTDAEAFGWAVSRPGPGPYTVDNLPSGPHKVAFLSEEPGYLEGWNGGAPSQARAPWIELAPQQDVAGVDGAPRSVPCDRTATPAFPDIPTRHPFCYEVNWLDRAGVAGGYPDGRYHPRREVTRQSMAAFLHRYPTTEAWPAPASAPFSDVPRHHEFAAEIDWLASTGITGGYPDGSFRPTAPVSRQSMAAFLYRLAGEPAFTPIDAQIFRDVPRDHRYFDEIMWLAFSGIGGGYGDGSFGASDPVSRQSMATFLRRFDLVVGGPGAGVDPRVAGGGTGSAVEAVRGASGGGLLRDALPPGWLADPPWDASGHGDLLTGS